MTTYPANVREFARRLYAHGYSPYRIHKSLKARGYGAAEDTIRCWVDPEYAEARAMRKRNGRKPGRDPRRGYSRRFARMEELRALGLSFRDIAAVMSNDFEGIELTTEQVRSIFRGWMSDRRARRLLWPEEATV